MVDAGKMTRDEAVTIIQDLIQSEAQASGALKASQAFMIEQGQPVQAGE